MKQYWTIILMAFLFGDICTAQPVSQSIHERTLSNGSAMDNDVFSLVYDNPAMKSLQHTQTLNTLRLYGEYQKEDLPSTIQEGDGVRQGGVDVQSFIRKKNSSLWGQAYYKNGKKLGRCWNETSDFALLYPYVMGDTIGGNLKSEEYFFAGGYAYNNSKYIIGVEGAYRAAIEYRHADPRPKNLTGDLNVKIGVAKYLSAKYLLGIAGYARKYKQTNDLAFYNELGVPMIYHFTGLGTDYYRFRGAKGESFYKGHAFGASLELLPAMRSGISASIQYQNFQFDKVISSLNELPMAAVKEDKVKGEVAWRNTDKSLQHGIQGGFHYVRRTGSEHLFGAASGNIFPQIGTQEKYMNKIVGGDISGILEYTTSRDVRWSLLGQVDYTQIQTSYIYPEREMKVAFTTGQVDLRVAYPHKKWLFSGAFGILGKIKNTSRLALSETQSESNENLNAPIQSNYEALKANSYQLHTQLRTDYAWKPKYGIYLSIDHRYGKDQRSSQMQFINGAIGFTF